MSNVLFPLILSALATVLFGVVALRVELRRLQRHYYHRPSKKIHGPLIHLTGLNTHIRLARMSSGRYCLIRDLGLVKGGKGLRHHELVLDLSWLGFVRSLKSLLRLKRVEQGTSSQRGKSSQIEQAS